MQGCSRRILPEAYPDLKFVSNGVCHKCHEYGRKYATRWASPKPSELWAKERTTL
jgi:hypothetical protein